MKLFITETKDTIARENLRRIQQEVSVDQEILKGQWNFIKITFSQAVINFKYPHLLTFVPQDILQTSLIGVGSLTWNYADFDRTYLDITTTGACTVRAFIGLYAPNIGGL